MTILSLPDGSKVQTVTHPSGNQTVVTVLDKPGLLTLPPAPTPRSSEIAWIIPYTGVHPQTVAGAPKDAVWVDVSSSDLAYYGALYDMWLRGETFAILEHDVVCRPDVIEQFEECPEPWCAFGYADICHPRCMDAWANALGCVRFRKELVSEVPDALSAIPRDGWDWHNLCDGLGANLRAQNFTHHWHWPPVEHHHMGRNQGEQ